MMEFTGERLVPTVEGYDDLFLEHMARYIFASALVEGRRVLDIGCGCGYGSYHLAVSGAASVLGIDRSGEAIDYCREHYAHESLSFETRDALQTNLDGESFDAIVAFEVFEHLQGPDEFLAELHRLLRPDGVLVLSTPNARTYVAGGEGGENPFHVREYTAEEFQEFLDRHFEQVLYYVQNPSGGVSVTPAREESTGSTLLAETRLVLPPSESTWGASIPALASREASAYLIAVCCRKGAELRSLPGARLYSLGRDLAAASGDRARWVGQIEDVRKELEDRTRWVQNLKQELEMRDATIRRLQEEFEERTQWALELDRTVQEQARLIQTLQDARTEAV